MTRTYLHEPHVHAVLVRELQHAGDERQHLGRERTRRTRGFLNPKAPCARLAGPPGGPKAIQGPWLTREESRSRLERDDHGLGLHHLRHAPGKDGAGAGS